MPGASNCPGPQIGGPSSLYAILYAILYALISATPESNCPGPLIARGLKSEAPPRTTLYCTLYCMLYCYIVRYIVR